MHTVSHVDVCVVASGTALEIKEERHMDRRTCVVARDTTRHEV
jgi:hypothetical protein